MTAFDNHQSTVDGWNVCRDPAEDPRYAAEADDIAVYWFLATSRERMRQAEFAS